VIFPYEEIIFQFNILKQKSTIDQNTEKIIIDEISRTQRGKNLDDSRRRQKVHEWF
jgi:hypothetical protein